MGPGTSVDTIDGTEAVAPTDARIGKPRSVSFEYAVTETGSVAGVTNDEQDVRTVRFTLTDDGNGHLTVTRDPETGPVFVFTNRYAAGAATDQIVLTKQLAGRPPVDGEFTFALVEQSVGEEGPTGTVLTAVNDAQGKVAFPRITYTKPGSHVYTIAEVDEGTAGIILIRLSIPFSRRLSITAMVRLPPRMRSWTRAVPRSRT